MSKPRNGNKQTRDNNRPKIEWTREETLKRGAVAVEIESREGREGKLYSVSVGRLGREGRIMRFMRPIDLDIAASLLQEARFWIDADREETFKSNKSKKGKYDK